MQRHGNLDRARLTDLADRYAIALCFLHCIDEAVDGFAEAHEEEAWDVILLVNKAKHILLDGMPITRFDEDAMPIIKLARDQREINIRDTELYREALNVVRQTARKTQ